MLEATTERFRTLVWWQSFVVEREIWHVIRYFVKRTIQDCDKSPVHATLFGVVGKAVWVIMGLLDQRADGDFGLIKDDLFILGLVHDTRDSSSYRKSACLKKVEQGFH